MEVDDELTQKKKAVDRYLEQLLSREDSLIDKAMRYVVFSGGKRFRPLLALSSGECFGVSHEVVLPFACALELIHNYSLIHDDLPSMDDDDFRRGKPSCHKAFGENIALLAGDSLLTMAFEVMAKAPVEEKCLTKKEILISEISRLAGVEGMIGGQALDISSSPSEMTEEGYYELTLKKTGSLLIASLKVGAILGDAVPSQIQALEEYGRNLGLAFQIRDDIIDSYGGSSKDHPSRPDAVLLFGDKEAQRKLRVYIERATRSLEDGGLECEKLRYLALKLLETGR
jgi:geranylgeranyl diphosphate synthase type II